MVDHPSNAAIYAKVAPLPATPASEATSQLILAAIGGSGISFFTDHTQAGPAERDGVLGFAITATDIGTGPIPAVDINIVGISAVMEKSTGGGAFSNVGITQPIFTKALGLALTSYLIGSRDCRQSFPQSRILVRPCGCAHGHPLCRQGEATPFVAISGAGDFGTDPGDTANVLGPDDTPVRGGSITFDMRRLSIVDVSNANLSYLRVIWGTALQTEAVAEAAGQYTEVAVQQPTAAGQNKPQEIMLPRRPVGSQIWARVKNATNNATVSFVIGIHEYPGP